MRGWRFLYKVFPNARVRFRDALFAAFVAGSAWEVAKFLFAWASSRMVQVHRIYGSVAVLPITLNLDLHLLVHRAGRMPAVLLAGRIAQAEPHRRSRRRRPGRRS